MQELSFSPQEQEALFEVIVRKIPSIKEPSRLKELVKQAVSLMLRRPEDQSLRSKLTQCVNEMFTGVASAPPSAVKQAQGKRTARDCIEVLQAAKEHRLPRDIVYPYGASSGHEVKKGVKHPVSAEPKATASILIAASVFAAILVGSVAWQSNRANHDSIFVDAKTFTGQMIASANSSEVVESPFGGHIKQQTVDGKQKVLADKVPNRICAASGWTLVHHGILTVNGVTPKRVSSAIITDLCYSAKGEVSIAWEPKAYQ